MTTKILLFFKTLIVISISLVLSQKTLAEPSVIKLDAGSIKGEVSEGIRVFKGIPYAKPPVSNLRWRPPVDAVPWEGVLETTKFGPDCPRPAGLVNGDRGGQGSVHGAGYDLWISGVEPGTREDCLTLNVWAPATPVNNAPVMVFISPTGSGSLPYFDGSSFAKNGVVLITINNRLFTLGSFAHPALRKDNNNKTPHSLFTSLDRLAALRWVQDNIAAFGGDPNNVTAFGESNGGGGVLELMTISEAEGLFHKAIVQSGSARGQSITYGGLEKIGVELSKIAGLDGANATAEELRALPLEALPFFAAGTLNENLLPENRSEAFAKGKTLKIPLMIGGNSWDGSSLRYSPQVITDRTNKEVVELYRKEGLSGDALGYAIYTDEHVNAPARWYAAQQAKRGVPVYHYVFSYVLSLRKGQLGAAHGDEIPFVFNSWEQIPVARKIINNQDRAMSHTMHACWIAFAKTGAPKCDGVSNWPAYDNETRWTMELNSHSIAHQGYRSAQYDALDKDFADHGESLKEGSEVVKAIQAAQTIE